MSQFSFGILKVSIKYTYTHGNATYFQRAVPRDLQDRYSEKVVKVKLSATDPVKQVREVEQLKKALDAEWARLRADPSASPRTIREQASALLKRWGLAAESPGSEAAEIAKELFFDELDRKRAAFADGDEDAYAEAPLDHFLTPVEAEAVRLLNGSSRPTLEDALRLYIDTSGKSTNEKFVRDSQRSVSGFVEANGGGEIALDAINRQAIRTFEQSQRAKGNTTTTVRRRLNTLSAIFRQWMTEHELVGRNPFDGYRIEGEGLDSRPREAFDHAELRLLRQAITDEDDEMRWLVGMLMDTGARLAEVAGLRLEDIRLSGTVPYIWIRPYEARDVKGRKPTTSKSRQVPLVGLALWAARRITESSTPQQTFAFPRYTDEEGCRATSASNALNKWMRSIGLNHTCHELRHTMNNRLKAVGCPEAIQEQTLGWSTGKKMIHHYGNPYALEQCIEHWKRIEEHHQPTAYLQQTA